MMQDALVDDLLESEDTEQVDGAEETDGFEDAFAEIDELAADDNLEDLDAADELSDVDAAEDEDLNALDESEDGDVLDELDAAGDLADEFEDELYADDDRADELDEFGDFAVDARSGLYLPTPRRLITGPAAVAIAQRLNPFVVESMDADDADAFFRRIGRGLRRIGRGIRRVAGRVGRVVGRVARVAAPILRRVLPMVQRVAGLAGPWGRLVSAGLGAVRGLAEGRGLRGALAGAAGGLIPGIGGRVAGALLGAGNALDDDAALDALADMADANEVPAAVALPLGAGLATRIATPRVAGNITPAVARHAVLAERAMLRAVFAAGGSPGRRLRILRLIARLVRARLRALSSAGQAAAVLAPTTQAVAAQVVRQARQRPAMGVISPAAAARRVMARRRILRRLPVAALYPRLRSRPRPMPMSRPRHRPMARFAA